MSDLKQCQLQELLHYNPITGCFTWKKRDIKYFTDGYFKASTSCKKWNSRFSGKNAGFLCNTWGYILTSILSKKYRAHHLAFLYMTGRMPVQQVDHINHDRADNRWVNLREVSHQENSHNQSMRSTNTSGTCGVYFNRARKQWYSQIMTNGKTITLGAYTDKKDAIKARMEANKKYGFHKNHGGN